MALIPRHRAIQHEPYTRGRTKYRGDEGHGEAALTLRDGHRAAERRRGGDDTGRRRREAEHGKGKGFGGAYL
jgi:hypothetical protein